MAKNKKPPGNGFDNTEENKAITYKNAEVLIKKRKWTEAIDAFSKIRPKAKEDLRNEISIIFKEAVHAGLQNQDLRSLTLHCYVLGLNPKNTDAMRNLAVLLKRSGHLEDALFFTNKCLEIEPNHVDARNTLGTILADLGQRAEAICAFREALKQNPNCPNANNNIANQYHLDAQIDKAYIHSCRAVKAKPDFAALWLDHLTHLRRVCDHDRLEKMNWWNVLNTIHPSIISTSFLQVLTLGSTKKEQVLIKELIQSWGNTQLQQASEQPIPPLSNPPLRKGEPLRIGFISADFRDHSIARFIWPLFEHLDRSEFSLFCYSTLQEKDSWRKRFEASANVIRDVNSLSPQQLTETIRGDNIHVLFDLTGFTNGSRTGSLAWRAAPAQVSWLGFPGTSGLKAMDYLFLDRYLTPTDPNLITEQALQSQGTTVCFSEIDLIPITKTIPELRRGFLTFGTLNNTYKMTRETIKRWASVLHQVPSAQFLFARREFDSYLLRKNILKEFERAGIGPNRIHFYNNRKENRHYLDCYNEIDITLDTFPVTGGTTTTDALWMGVPVVGLEGPNVHQRVCSAILHHAGHPEWIAKSNEEFVQIAHNLAKDQKTRIKLRETLRSEIKKSPLCDSKKFAEDFGDCMRELSKKL